MPVLPQPMDDLPLPKPVESKPLPNLPQPERVSPNEGWTPPSGGAAHIAERILTGWMAGKNLREQKNQEKAVKQVGDAKGIYDTLAGQYRQMLDAGRPAQDPEVNTLKNQIGAAWNNYIEAASHYTGVNDAKAKPKKGMAKVASGPLSLVHKMFGVEDPVLIAKGSLDVLKQGGPPALHYSPDATAQMEREKTALQLKAEQEKVAKEADVTALQKQRDDAIKGGDKKAQLQAEQQLAGYGINIQEPDSQAERDVKQRVAESKLKAMDNLTKVKDVNELSAFDKVILGVPPESGAMGAYYEQVGPDKKFKSRYEAARAYNRDLAINASMSSLARSPYEEMKKSTRAILEHELEDPTKAKAYGIQPLRPGERVPDWVVEKETLTRYRETTEDKQNIMAQRRQAGSRAVQMVVNGLSPEDQDFVRNTLIDQDDNGNLSLSPEVKGKKESHHFGEDTINGVPVSQIPEKQKTLARKVAMRLRQLYPGASDDVIRDAVGVSPKDLEDSAAEDKKERELGPTPPAVGTKRYRVTDTKGKTDVREMTPEEAKQASGYGFKVEPDSAYAAPSDFVKRGG